MAVISNKKSKRKVVFLPNDMKNQITIRIGCIYKLQSKNFQKKYYFNANQGIHPKFQKIVFDFNSKSMKYGTIVLKWNEDLYSFFYQPFKKKSRFFLNCLLKLKYFKSVKWSKVSQALAFKLRLPAEGEAERLVREYFSKVNSMGCESLA